jgi:hypothetical protein
MNGTRWASWFIGAVLAAATAACGRPKLQVLGDSAKLEQGAPLPRRSPLFDGERLRLRAARGETVGVQIVFSEPPNAQVALELPGHAAEVTGFRVGYLNVTQPSTEMYGESLGRGLYPDILVPKGRSFAAEGHAFFDVSVPRTATPGRYAGTLRVAEHTFPAELRVEPVTIDLARDPLVWVFYLPKEIARIHRIPDVDNAALLKLERVYHELFREHGTYLAANIRPDRFPARREFVRGVDYWPVSLDTSSDASIAADVQRWLAFFESSDVTPFAIPIDEPRTVAEKQRARQIADSIGRAGGGRPKLLRGVTDAVSPVYGRAIDVYLSPKNIPAVAASRRPQGERYWTYNGKPPQAGSLIIDTEGVALRTWGWIAERYGLELWHAWEGVYFEDRYNKGGPTDVFHDPITFDERSKGGSDFGNGDGVLVYPGPMPSLRLKALRRGLQDRLLLRRLSDCGHPAEARAIVARVVPRALGEAKGEPSWSKDEAVWERARADVLDALVRRCRDAA